MVFSRIGRDCHFVKLSHLGLEGSKATASAVMLEFFSRKVMGEMKKKKPPLTALQRTCCSCRLSLWGFRANQPEVPSKAGYNIWANPSIGKTTTLPCCHGGAHF
jgi:hypothetical protein